MRVYRLQNKDGFGPFHMGSSIIGFITNHKIPEDMCSTHSKDYVSSKLGRESWVFAWNKKELMCAFFKGPFSPLDNSGYRVVVFDVLLDSIVFEDGQVLFDREGANQTGGSAFLPVSTKSACNAQAFV